MSAPLVTGPQAPAPQSLSVVVPLYRCEACIVELHGRLVNVLSGITPQFEIILVNDGSPQGDWRVARQLAEGDGRVKAINLSRNFGQHYAIACGIDCAEGDWVVVMDGDLQDPPEEIPRLYQEARRGNHDVVFGCKPRRSHGTLKRLTSRLFSRVLGFLMDTQLDNAVTHFSLFSQTVARNLRRFRERNRSHAFLLRWLGFDVGYITVQHHRRFAGDGSYTLRRQLALALELIISQSDKPLRITISFGFATSLAAFAYGLYQMIRYAFYDIAVSGWTSIIVSIYFLGGLILVALGVVGLYIGRIFDETKGRPLYVVKDAVNVSGSAAKNIVSLVDSPPQVIERSM